MWVNVLDMEHMGFMDERYLRGGDLFRSARSSSVTLFCSQLVIECSPKTLVFDYIYIFIGQTMNLLLKHEQILIIFRLLKHLLRPLRGAFFLGASNS